MTLPNLVAMITSDRWPPPTRKCPISSSLLPSAYMSAVSKKLTPTSIAASITSRVRASSMRPPKLLHPTPTTDTWREPILRVSTRAPLDRRGGLSELHARRLLVRFLAEELHPLLLQVRVVLRRFHQIDEAFDRRLEPILQLAVLDPARVVERVMRLRERKHVGIYARAEMLERLTQRPQTDLAA